MFGVLIFFKAFIAMGHEAMFFSFPSYFVYFIFNETNRVPENSMIQKQKAGLSLG